MIALFKKHICPSVNGLCNKIKIRHKIIILAAISTIVLIGFAAGSVVMGQKQINTLEEIYVGNFIPLDQLRTIQLKFREIEFRMGGAVADMITPTAAVNHLKVSVSEVDELVALSTKLKVQTEEYRTHANGMNNEESNNEPEREYNLANTGNDQQVTV